MLDDPFLGAATLTELLVYARSGPSTDELLEFFTVRVLDLVGCAKVEVRQGQAGGCGSGAADGSAGGHVACFPVSSGDTSWGELHLTYRDGPPGIGETHLGRLLAEVLGAALVTAAATTAAPVAARSAGVEPSDPDHLVGLVLDCAEELDRMPEASTRARLALVAGRLADSVGAASWSVGVAHHGRLHDVSCAGAACGDHRHHQPVARACPVVLARFPARHRASEGGAYYADRRTGDDEERRALVEDGHLAVVGAGGYDLDGRSWVVEVFDDTGVRLDQLTAVLAGLVLAALSFPREAFVPRPLEPWVRGVLRDTGVGRSDVVRGIGATG